MKSSATGRPPDMTIVQRLQDFAVNWSGARALRCGTAGEPVLEIEADISSKVRKPAMFGVNVPNARTASIFVNFT